MGNRKQRDQNRQTAYRLSQQVKPRFPCPNCGVPTHGHYIGPSIGESGFWTCPILYGSDGHRLEDGDGCLQSIKPGEQP